MKQWLRSYIMRRAASSKLFAKIHYGMLSSTYVREQSAFLNGVAHHNSTLPTPQSGHAFLRRNIHRIEKGLLMRPRRGLFAVDYINDTVLCFSRVAQRGGPISEASNVELQWAFDVLRQYFSIADGHPEIHKSRAIFEATKTNCDSAIRCVPHVRNESNRPTISIQQFEALAKYRRSVRWFLPKSVEREKIDRAIEIAFESPSACNRQPFVFRVIDDANLLTEVSRIPGGTIGYADNIPLMIVIVGQQRNYQEERDRHLIYIDGSLAAMSFVFAAELQGLSTCCINWPDIEEKELKMCELLQLAADERPIMCIAVGYADPSGMIAYSAKKPLDEARSFNLE